MERRKREKRIYADYVFYNSTQIQQIRCIERRKQDGAIIVPAWRFELSIEDVWNAEKGKKGFTQILFL